MTNLKLENRKNTTEKALEELQNLIDTFDDKLESDVNTVKSDEFYGRILVSNGKYTNDCYYDSWENTEAYWVIENGCIEIASIDDGCREKCRHTLDDIRIRGFRQIYFGDAIKALEEVIKKYNTECIKKDTQIEKFLGFCKTCNA